MTFENRSQVTYHIYHLFTYDEKEPLGIEVKRTCLGLRVMEVKEGSVLKNVVSAGDVIVAVSGDDSNTSDQLSGVENSEEEKQKIIFLDGSKAAKVTKSYSRNDSNRFCESSTASF